jgi:hypothetical protein
MARVSLLVAALVCATLASSTTASILKDALSTLGAYTDHGLTTLRHKLQLKSDPTPLQACSATTDVALLFQNASACEAYQSSPRLVGLPSQTYANCSSSALCVTYMTSFTANVAGSGVVGVVAQNAWGFNFDFANAFQCQEAAANTSNVVGSFYDPQCFGNVFKATFDEGSKCDGSLSLILDASTGMQLEALSLQHC